jgi:hypothetical protein
MSFQIAWKPPATNSLVPSFSRPDLTAAGPAFKAQPINHWRKQLIPLGMSGGSNRRAGISLPMNTPSGAVATIDEATLGNARCLKDSIVEDNVTTCHIIRRASTLLKKNYYSDRKAYLRSRTLLYEQKLTQNPNCCQAGTDADAGTGPSPSPSISNLNNKKFGQQGAVDSSSRLTRLKLDTVNTNAASYRADFNTTAPQYRGMAATPYFLKSKYQVPVPTHLTGAKTTTCCIPSYQRYDITILGGPENATPGATLFTGYFLVNSEGIIVDFFEGTTSCLLPKNDVVYISSTNKYPFDEEGVNFISQHLADGLVGLTTLPKFNLFFDNTFASILTLFQSATTYSGQGDLNLDYYTIII